MNKNVSKLVLARGGDIDNNLIFNIFYHFYMPAHRDEHMLWQWISVFLSVCAEIFFGHVLCLTNLKNEKKSVCLHFSSFTLLGVAVTDPAQLNFVYILYN